LKGWLHRQTHHKTDNEFRASTLRLAGMMREYNRVECKVASIERRPPRWFLVELPPGPIVDVKVLGDSVVFTMPPVDALVEAVDRDIKTICEDQRR
jgi:hypothetical protein